MAIPFEVLRGGGIEKKHYPIILVTGAIPTSFHSEQTVCSHRLSNIMLTNEKC